MNVSINNNYYPHGGYNCPGAIILSTWKRWIFAWNELICKRVQMDYSFQYEEQTNKVFRIHTEKHFHDLEADKCLSKAKL